MKKRTNENTQDFITRRAQGHELNKAAQKPHRVKVDKLPFARLSHTTAPSKFWRFFKTRTKSADGKYYKYKTKKKFKSLVARGQFWEIHGRYQDLVNPVVV